MDPRSVTMTKTRLSTSESIHKIGISCFDKTSICRNELGVKTTGETGQISAAPHKVFGMAAVYN